MTVSEADRARIRAEAQALGFTLVGFAPAGGWPGGEHLVRWLEAGHHAQMRWLERAPEVRVDPRRRFPWARTALLLGVPYRTDDETSPAECRAISRYAWGTDYHEVLPKRLRALAARLRERWPTLQVYWFTDTSPVLERAAARAAGLGWIGRNCMLIHEREGSYVFLAGMLLSIEVAFDRPAPDRCGRCTRCLPACPTGALIAPYTLDARRCISYLTIEHRGAIPHALRPLMGTLVFGCDICQEVCPWNERALRKEARAAEGPFKARAGLAVTDRALLESLLGMSEEAFRARFRKSAIKRAKRRGLARNAAVALGNLGDARALPALRRALAGDPEPLVRGHAAWALGRLLGRAQAREREASMRALAHAAAHDPDPAVRDEARMASTASRLPRSV